MNEVQAIGATLEPNRLRWLRILLLRLPADVAVAVVVVVVVVAAAAAAVESCSPLASVPHRFTFVFFLILVHHSLKVD